MNKAMNYQIVLKAKNDMITPHSNLNDKNNFSAQKTNNRSNLYTNNYNNNYSNIPGLGGNKTNLYGYGGSSNSYSNSNEGTKPASSNSLIRNNIMTKDINENYLKSTLRTYNKKPEVTEKITNVSNNIYSVKKGMTYEEVLKFNESKEISSYGNSTNNYNNNLYGKTNSKNVIDYSNTNSGYYTKPNIISEIKDFDNTRSIPVSTMGSNKNTFNPNNPNINSNTKPNSEYITPFNNSSYYKNNNLKNNNNEAQNNNKNSSTPKGRIPVNSTFDDKYVYGGTSNTTRVDYTPPSTVTMKNPTITKAVKNYAIKEEQHMRDYMEDCTRVSDNFLNTGNIGYFSLYDGHGGKDTSFFINYKIK
jgi:hypothetical protein